ncbi:hypothetical protein F2Q70_00022131 [Brassica cretica]|uniref:thioglucosidase n=1 Tax=Brassica cretica TaxID=69181 RepID=A0A8S9GL52_BRACR|nr:hypothetical protein F2Q70_00022131 [Brassica cretica]
MFSTMECQKAQFFVIILVILFAVSSSKNVCNPACKAKEPFNCDNPLTFNRTSFPKNFTFGAATSAYQIEGASHRALNGWDYFTHRYPEKVPDHSSGDLACDSYDLYKEDVKLLKRMKAQAYRLSIAWSRILPKAVALRQACAAVLERSYIRNQNTAELFIGHSDNIDDAEA